MKALLRAVVVFAVAAQVALASDPVVMTVKGQSVKQSDAVKWYHRVRNVYCMHHREAVPMSSVGVERIHGEVLQVLENEKVVLLTRDAGDIAFYPPIATLNAAVDGERISCLAMKMSSRFKYITVLGAQRVIPSYVHWPTMTYREFFRLARRGHFDHLVTVSLPKTESKPAHIGTQRKPAGFRRWKL